MDFFTDIVLLLASAVAVVVVFDRLHLPPIIGFLVAGMLGGPHGFGLVSEVSRVMQISEVGIVLLLFLIGVELSLAQFFRMWRVTIIGGGLQVVLTVAFFTTILVVVGFKLPVALFWANQQGSGVHVNVSGAGITTHAKNAAGAQGLLEWLSTAEPQLMFSELNLEYPASPAVEPVALVQSWGSFKPDTINVETAGRLQADAVKLMDRADYR